MDLAAEPFCRIRPLPVKTYRPDTHHDREKQTSDRTKAGLVPIEVVDSPFFEAAFCDETKLAELLSGAPHTERMRLASHNWLSPEFLTSLGSLLPRLKELNLRNTRVTDSAVTALAAGCRELRCLDLGECDLLQNISCIAEFRELSELWLPRCIHAVTSELVGNLHTAARLTLLDLSFCPNFDNSGLLKLSTGCRSLRWLSLSSCEGVGDEGVFAVVSHNAGIEHLELAMNLRLSDHQTGDAIRCLRRLRHLNVSGCPQLSKETPCSVGKHCEYIEEVLFAGGERIGDEEMKQLFQRCTQLRSLDIAGCRNISSDFFVECIPHAPALQKLFLSFIPSVSEELLMYLKEAKPNCAFECHAHKHADPDDLSSILRMPPKGSVMQTKGPAKTASKASKLKGKKSKKR